MSLNFYKGAAHLPEMAKLTKEKSEKRKLTLEAFKGRAARRALTISIFLIVMNQLCGCYALLSYTTKVFEEAGASLSPIESSVLIVGVQLSANMLTIYLVDRVGRKILFITSALGAAVGIACLGLHSLYRDQLDDFRWIPIASLSFAIFIASLGLLSLPYTIAIDILPPKVWARRLIHASAITVSPFHPFSADSERFAGVLLVVDLEFGVRHEHGLSHPQRLLGHAHLHVYLRHILHYQCDILLALGAGN